MFKQRLIMTLILVPMVLAGIFYLPSLGFACLLGVLVLIMLYEWQQFIVIEACNQVWFKWLILGLGSLICMKFWKISLYLDLGFWLFASVFVLRYPKYQQIWRSNAFVTINAWVLIGVFAALMLELQADNYGQIELVCLLFLVWAADIGAYLFGRRWGQHKMIPQVSPGKSWEGLLGGLLSVMIVATLELALINPFSLWSWYGLVLVTGLISVIGDLWMSMLKRRSQLKDSGHLIPGHGGVLDRMDSMLAALPVFYLGLNVINSYSFS